MMMKPIVRLSDNHYRNYLIVTTVLLLNISVTPQATSQTLSNPFTVNASIVKGCMLGSASNDPTTFGNISFGNISSLFSDINLVSAQNAGSVVVKCTPGISVTIAIDAGLNSGGSVSNGRFMKMTTGASTLRYQLYQDSNYSTVWGNGSNGGQIYSYTADGTVKPFSLYARLFATTALPAVGQYSDTVNVTITY